MIELISVSTQIVHNGDRWIRFEAGQPQIVPDDFVQACIVAGCTQSNSPPLTDSVAVEKSDRIALLVDAMLDILTTGDAKLLTKDGQTPRHSAVAERVDFEFTADERKAAWDIVKDGDSE